MLSLYGVNQAQVQRYLSSRTEKEAVRCAGEPSPDFIKTTWILVLSVLGTIWAEKWSCDPFCHLPADLASWCFPPCSWLSLWAVWWAWSCLRATVERTTPTSCPPPGGMLWVSAGRAPRVAQRFQNLVLQGPDSSGKSDGTERHNVLLLLRRWWFTLSWICYKGFLDSLDCLLHVCSAQLSGTWETSFLLNFQSHKTAKKKKKNPIACVFFGQMADLCLKRTVMIVVFSPACLPAAPSPLHLTHWPRWRWKTSSSHISPAWQSPEQPCCPKL